MKTFYQKNQYPPTKQHRVMAQKTIIVLLCYVHQVEAVSSIHSVTIKLRRGHCYSNTTNAIYCRLMGLVREKVYLYDVPVSAFVCVCVCGARASEVTFSLC
jgi:hypothetical protein